MSLQVWLPLNEDLRNNGIYNCEIIDKNTIFNNNWSCDFNDSYILLHNPPILDGDYSFSFWIKANYDNLTNWARIYYFGKPNTNYIITAAFYQKSIYPFDYIFEQSDTEWVHVIITHNCKTNKKYLFIDGELKSQTNSTNNFTTEDATLNWGCIGARNDNSTTLSSNRFNGSLRDFRIYDHCLSVKEIKELSKGLILHYPFNNNGLGYCNPNLLINSAPDNITSQWYAYNTSEQIIYNSFSPSGKVIRFKVKNDNINYYDSRGVYMSITSAVKNLIINDGGVYTLSAYIRSTKPLKISFRSELMINNNVIELSAQWKLFSFSSLINTDSTKSANTFYASFRSEEEYANITEDDYVEICMVKLEKGDKATTWIPNEADPEYLESLLDTSIVNDTSGFGTYGIVNGDLSYDADSPVYRSSIKSSADGNYIQGAKTLPNFDKMTLSFWINPLKSNTYCAFADLKSGLAFGVGASNNIICSVFRHNLFENTSSLIINQWNHIVVKKNDSSSVSLYINNQLISPISTIDNWGHSASTFRIFHRYNGASTYYTTGKLSDLRIYSTALSEDDIKELYESKISVDKNGNVYIKNIIEE